MPRLNKPINAGLRDAAAAHAKKRSDTIVVAIRDAMIAIDEEMANHDQLYPRNGGKLNGRELCRRAGISFMTLQGPAHKDTTRKTVETWLASKSEVTKKTVAKAITDRVKYWKEQHRLVATQILIYELQEKEKDLAITQLREENARLRAQLVYANNGRIVKLAKTSAMD